MSPARPTTPIDLAEVNPPLLPSTEPHRLGGRRREVLITDNLFRQARVSPNGYAARITHLRQSMARLRAIPFLPHLDRARAFMYEVEADGLPEVGAARHD